MEPVISAVEVFPPASCFLAFCIVLHLLQYTRRRFDHSTDFYIPLDSPTLLPTTITMAPVALSDPAATAAPTVTKASSDFDPGHVQVGAKSMNFPAPPTFQDPMEERRFKLERLAGAFRIFGKLGYDEGVSTALSVAEVSHSDFIPSNRSAVTSVRPYQSPNPLPC